MEIPSLELSDNDRELVTLAQRTIDAVAGIGPGVHTMGSAVRSRHGSTYQAIDVIHPAGGPPAELVAIANARASGAEGLTRIVTVGGAGEGPPPPCGKVRQVLLDYFPAIRVIMPVNRTLRVVRIRDLLPFGVQWTLENRFVERFDSNPPVEDRWPIDQ